MNIGPSRRSPVLFGLIVFAVVCAILVIALSIGFAVHFLRSGPGPSIHEGQASVTIDVGEAPWGVAVDTATHTVYVTNKDSDTVSVIDGATRTVTATIGVGDNPRGLAIDPATHSVYVANSQSNSVSVIDGASLRVVATVAVGDRPFGVAVDSAEQSVYVTNYLGNSVSVIDTERAAVEATIQVGTNPSEVVVDTTTHTAYVINVEDWTMSVIDTTNNTVAEDIYVGGSPHGVAVDPATQTIYVGVRKISDGEEHTFVLPIDAENRTSTTVVSLDGDPVRTALDSDNHVLYATVADPDRLVVIDPRTRAVTDIFKVGDFPGGIAVDPETRTVYVANFTNGTIAVVIR